VSVLPNLIAIIVQPPWRSEVRGLVTFAICIVADAPISFPQGDLQGRDRYRIRNCRGPDHIAGALPDCPIYRTGDERQATPLNGLRMWPIRACIAPDKLARAESGSPKRDVTPLDGIALRRACKDRWRVGEDEHNSRA
jgi:hypothetical protein